MDLSLPQPLKSLFRRDWGTQNTVGMDAPVNPVTMRNDFRQQQVRRKIAQFCRTAIFPQQLTVPRQYATTQEGVFIYKILEGRQFNAFREDGVRVVVQENAKQARFIMSPLFSNKQDALSWAVKEMGADL